MPVACGSVVTLYYILRIQKGRHPSYSLRNSLYSTQVSIKKCCLRATGCDITRVRRVLPVLSSENRNMTFSHVNPVTNKTWTRDELHAALLQEQAKNSTDGLISRDRYIQDITARWQIHLKESRAFVIDLFNAGRWTRTQFNRLLA